MLVGVRVEPLVGAESRHRSVGEASVDVRLGELVDEWEEEPVVRRAGVRGRREDKAWMRSAARGRGSSQ